MNSFTREPASNAGPAASTINYDGPALAELSIDGVDFRVDAGKQGTSLCISQRATGTWDWCFTGEAKWDGSSLRAKNLGQGVLKPLSATLAQALADQG
jgi:hypothetical protein